MVDERFLEEIDAAYPKLGYSDRASFIREAVYQRMKEGGYKLPLEYKAAPSRKGKGGRQSRKLIQAVSSVSPAPASNTRKIASGRAVNTGDDFPNPIHSIPVKSTAAPVLRPVVQSGAEVPGENQAKPQSDRRKSSTGRGR